MFSAERLTSKIFPTLSAQPGLSAGTLVANLFCRSVDAAATPTRSGRRHRKWCGDTPGDRLAKPALGGLSKERAPEVVRDATSGQAAIYLSRVKITLGKTLCPFSARMRS